MSFEISTNFNGHNHWNHFVGGAYLAWDLSFSNEWR